jgi:ATP-binding cassette, subfamily F, member 3
VLSGGERNRYALARMLLRPANFLLLDEPTNHLDLRAKDVLLEALQKYSGTVVFVSHDRYFIDRLATRVFEIGGGEVHDFPGNYEDYLWQKEGNAIRADEPKPELAPAASAAGNDNGNSGDPGPQPKKLNPILVRRMQDRGEELEEEIARAEAEITSCELKLAQFKSAEESIRLSSRIGELRNGINAMTREWEEIELALNESAG